MPPMKIQPIDVDSQRLKESAVIRNDSTKLVLKSRLRRLFVFDRQFPSVLRTSSSEKAIGPGAGETLQSNNKDGGGGTEFEPSSVCLAKMVQNFMEESNEKPQQQQQQPASKCGRNRCNCFNSNTNDSSDEELDVFGSGSFTESTTTTDPTELLKSLIPCVSVTERELLANTAKIVENSKVYERKDDLKKIAINGLLSLGYDCSICKSKWDKTSSYPAGEYEFIDAIIEGQRFLIDIDFRSEFEIARSTGTYKAILQSLPFIFIGKPERLGQIVSIVSEAAKQSLKKKGMHVPPWRKADYMLAKWLSSSCVRAKQPPSYSSSVQVAAVRENQNGDDDSVTAESDCGELELIFGEKASPPEPEADSGVKTVAMPAWQPPALKPKSVEKGAKVVTGLASLLKDKP